MGVEVSPLVAVLLRAVAPVSGRRSLWEKYHRVVHDKNTLQPANNYELTMTSSLSTLLIRAWGTECGSLIGPFHYTH